MARRKIPTEHARSRAESEKYAKSTIALRKKAEELAELTGARVALVCAPAAGAAGSRLVWESEGGGVLDRYRALPPETRARARHSHRGYLEAELGKERARLARARKQGASRGALADWDQALDGMTREQMVEVLGAVDAKLRATGDRMAALGLPLAPGDDDDDASEDAAAVAPEQLVDVDCAGFQPEMMPGHGGGNGHVGGEGLLLEQFLMNPGYGYECSGGGNYDAGAVYHMEEPAGYGLTMCAGGGNYDAGAVYGMQAPASCDYNAGCGWPDLSMGYAADESRDALVPVGYYPDFAALAPQYYAQDITGGDYAAAPPIEYPMGMMNENFAYHHMANSYAADWQAEEFQSCKTATGHYQYQ